MTPQELKNSILQLAIQGKLVEQRPEEGTAEELFAQIQEEKQRLIAEKKIKKEKALPEIADEEKPFDIPDSWKWVRLRDICSKITDGTHHSPPNSEVGKYRYITAKNIKDSGIDLTNISYVSQETHEEIYSRCNPEQGDILLIKDGATTGVVTVNNLVEAFSMLSSVALLKKSVFTDAWYVVYALRSDLFYKAIRSQMKGTGITRITLKQIEPIVVPLPPLAEQKRIVAKIEELLPYIDRYEQAWSKLEQFNSRFPEDMKKSLLQYAIQGKLVEQRPEEGTAEELFAQIQEEKQRLIAEKKIKKEKPLPEITDEEKLFDIPDSWKWVRLTSVASKITDGEHKTPRRVDSYYGFYLLSARNIRDGYILLDDVDYVDEEEFNKISLRCNPKRGDILISCSGSVGRCAVVEDDNLYVMVRSAAMISPVLLNAKFLMHAIQSEIVQKQIRNKTKQTAQANLFQEAIRNLVIPIPPLAEQKRIVEKLEQLLPLCERLK